MKAHDILIMLSALAGVIAMILLARFGSRSIGFLSQRKPGMGRLGLEASLAIDPRRRVVLLRCDRHQLLLLTGGPGDILLGWLPQPEPSQTGDGS